MTDLIGPCGCIITEEQYHNTPRRMVENRFRKYTSLKCPVCGKENPGINWMEVEYTSTTLK